MRIAALTLFPGLFETYKSEGLFDRAVNAGLVDLTAVDIRDFTLDKHRTADDIPYGGGPGMVMKPEPVVRAVESLGEDFAGARTIIMSPRGSLFTQSDAEELSLCSSMVLICGRYKGIDERVAEIIGATEISVGDYILGAGEIAALAVIDSVVRLIPGYLGDIESAESDSLGAPNRLLSAPEYTRPREFRGLGVPEVLLSGNHAAIEKWKRRESLRITLERRPEILEKADLSDEERRYLEGLKKQ
ncbi:tRNA (guanosine(37)-N1)-methyltransferase TrmD [bacterium]|nr:MAG: tRNA (guanosine(37)-N1)-methyltransferase TrmD [bacterium]